MSLSDSELIYANALDSLYYRRRVLAFEVAFVYIFDSIPTDTQEGRNILYRSDSQQVKYIRGKAMCIAAAAVCERYWLPGIIVTFLAFISLKSDSYAHWSSADGNAMKVSRPSSILYQSFAAAFRTTQHPVLTFRFYYTASFMALTTDISEAFQPELISSAEISIPLIT